MSASPPQAPGGVHEHVALPAPGYTHPANIRGRSFYMNSADNLWNYGEGLAADQGGMLTFDDGTGLTETHIHTTTGWAAHTPVYPSILPTSPTPMHRFVGYIAPNAVYPIESAFELFAPQSFVGNPQADTVIVISVFPTMGPPSPTDGGRFAYPGLRTDGLVPQGPGIDRPPPGSDYLVAWSGQPQADGLNIVAGYIVPRTTPRNLVSELQRTLQLERAIQKILQSATPGLQVPGLDEPLTANVPVVVAGGSFGGLVSQLLPMYFPDRLHGSVSASFSGSLRRTVGDQEAYTYLASLGGFSKVFSGTQYDVRDTLEWPALLRQLPTNPAGGRDYFDASFVDRFKAGLIQRPQYFLMSDEDTVTNGTEWRSFLVGSRAYSGAGSVPNPNAQSTSASAYWSILDKACHDTTRYDFPMPVGGPLGTGTGNGEGIDTLHKAPLPFLKIARASAAAAGSAPGTLATSAPQDTFDHALARGRTSEHGAGTQYLTEDTGFAARKGRNHGTWCGRFDSTLFYQDAGIRYVYVGSADGVVSRLKVNGTQLVRDAIQSESLGYGAWGLAIGNLGAGTRVYVATYRRIHELSLDLQTYHRSLLLPEFERGSPRHLQIADLYGNQTGHLVCHTALGQILVIAGNQSSLTVVDEYSEPGIVDLLVDTQHGVVADCRSRPIFIQSERGHVARICFGPNQNQVLLLGATVPLLGNPGGLCLEPGGNLAAAAFDVVEEGGDTLIGFFVHQISTSTAPAPGGDNMKLLQSRFVPYQADTGYGFEKDFACVGNDFLILKGGRLYTLPTGSGQTPDQVNLSEFPPAVFPCDVSVGQLDGDSGLEVVLSGEGGHLVWLDDTQITTLPTYQTSDPDAQTSGSLVATWGMTHDGTDLVVVDQAAQLWKVNPANGTVTFQELFSMDTATPVVPMKKPFRGLGRLENSLASVPVASSDETFKLSAASGFVLEARTFFPHVEFVPFIVLPPTFTPAPQWDWMAHHQLFAGQYVPFSYAGDTLSTTGKEYVFWWSGNRPFPRLFPGWGSLPIAIRYLNLLQGGTHDLGATPTFYHWSSSSNGQALHLRNVTDTESHNHQALRLGTWTTLENWPVVVVATTGGSVLVVDPGAFPHTTDGIVKAESSDYGYGGMALAVSDVNVQGNPSTEPLIFFAPLWTHAGSVVGEYDMVSSLVILRRGTGTSLDELQKVEFDGKSGGPPKLFGVCGLAIGDVDGGTTGGDEYDELVLTTVNGDIVVYDLVYDTLNAKVQLGALLHRAVHDGSLGLCNSILIADLTAPSGQNEVYIAGSSGIRKFTRQVNP